ncbi:MAG: hypothetical protein AAGF92_14925 [Myxococcota bacterium]
MGEIDTDEIVRMMTSDGTLRQSCLARLFSQLERRTTEGEEGPTRLPNGHVALDVDFHSMHDFVRGFGFVRQDRWHENDLKQVIWESVRWALVPLIKEGIVSGYWSLYDGIGVIFDPGSITDEVLATAANSAVDLEEARALLLLTERDRWWRG